MVLLIVVVIAVVGYFIIPKTKNSTNVLTNTVAPVISNTTDQGSGLKNYNNATYAVSFNYQQNLCLLEQSSSEGAAYPFEVGIVNSTDCQHANLANASQDGNAFSIIINKNPSVSLNQWKQIFANSATQLQQQYGETVESEDNITIDGLDAVRAKIKISEPSKSINYEYYAVYTIGSTQNYLVNYTTGDEYQSIFSSLRIK